MNLLSYSKTSSKFYLELCRVELLLKKAGDPDREFNIIHVAGTNGKGSVCSFIETGLVFMGEKCGRFSSPELFTVEDSITVCGCAIKNNELENIIDHLSPLCEDVKAELGKAPSPFEVLFVAAMVHFKNSGCKTVILECGMGGAGDATNAIYENKIAVLTDIDTDHTEYLGKTRNDIAKNKCGILRNGKTVISSVQYDDVSEVIDEECKKKNCSLIYAEGLKAISMDNLNAVVKIYNKEIRLSLAGVHQAKNAALAKEVLTHMGADEKVVTYALTHAKNRARLEEIKSGIYFDGAHNMAGVKALVDSINAAQIKGEMAFAVGFMADKDISGCFDLLKNLNNQHFKLYTATVHSNPRSETADRLKFMATSKGFEARSFTDILSAVKIAEKQTDKVFVFGSLYMYKELFDEKGELLL